MSLDVVMKTSSSPPCPLPQTNGIGATLRSLSLNTASAVPLPPSPQVASPQRATGQHINSSPAKNSPRSPLSRSPSVMSLDRRSSTPSLYRKVSMNSLHGVGGITPPRASPSRRSSTQLMGAPVGKSPLSGTEIVADAPQIATAASIASAYFKKELALHEGVESHPADTIVILHDSCYGHRYSRPRTSKASLSTIVERPERIQASILGVSMAYVRLGERHAEGKYPIHPKTTVLDIPRIPFRIRKTNRKLTLSSPAVTNVHGTKWMEELKIMCDSAEAKLAMNGKELARPEMNRNPEQGPPAKFHEGDLYLCSDSLDAMEGALGAVCEGVDAVFGGSADGKGPHRAFVSIRPPGHHCSADYPSGFCWLNNIHVGIAHATLHHGLTHAAIIDFDLHHGDGSQSIAWDHNVRALNLSKNAAPWKKTSIGYFSVHDINSYPCEMGDEEKIKNASLCIDNAHGQSIWNVHLQPWKSELEFWKLYETAYSVILEKARSYLHNQTQRLRSQPGQMQPKGAIFLSAGFDSSEWESSGMQRHKVNVPTEFYARLTRDVVKLAAEESCSVQGRVISVLEGGYSDRALSSGVLSHISGLAGGDPAIVKTELGNSGLGYEMTQKSGAFGEGNSDVTDSGLHFQPPYDSNWWSLAHLEALDALVKPPAPTEPKKQKDSSPPTYSSPTQSSRAKITTTKVQRSVSSTFSNQSSCSVSRAASPPPLEVHWTIAVHELSKLLIPSDRQTMSCRPEDLSAEATRARRDRQSSLILANQNHGQASSNPNSRMLRERKAKALSTPEEEDETERPLSRASRRRTVTGEATLNGNKTGTRGLTSKPEPVHKRPTKQSNRRLSLVSNATSVASAAPSAQVRSGYNRVPAEADGTASMRPGSSQSIRPDSSLSVRSHSASPVVVKKTRTAAQARTGASKVSRVNKKPHLAGDFNNVSGVDTAQGSLPASRVPSVSNASSSANSKDLDIDALTKGMKQIKITKTQRQNKEQKNLASKSTPSTSSTKPLATQKRNNDEEILQTDSPIPTLITEVSSNPNNNGETEPPSRTHIASIPQKLSPSRFAHLRDSSTPPLQLPPASVVQSSLASTSSGANVFIHYQPEGTAPTPVLQQEPLTWLPPNTSTPAPTKKVNLPVFTATGSIPFRPMPNSGLIDETKNTNNQPEKKEKTGPSIWDVPETPGH